MAEPVARHRILSHQSSTLQESDESTAEDSVSETGAEITFETEKSGKLSTIEIDTALVDNVTADDELASNRLQDPLDIGMKGIEVQDTPENKTFLEKDTV